MSSQEVFITILITAIGTYITRAAPFLIFSGDKPLPKKVSYLGNVLPAAAIGLLVVYCFKGLDLQNYPYGFKEIGASVITVVLHLYKRNYILSIAIGTFVYILLAYLF